MRFIPCYNELCNHGGYSYDKEKQEYYSLDPNDEVCVKLCKEVNEYITARAELERTLKNHK